MFCLLVLLRITVPWARFRGLFWDGSERALRVFCFGPGSFVTPVLMCRVVRSACEEGRPDAKGCTRGLSTGRRGGRATDPRDVFTPDRGGRVGGKSQFLACGGGPSFNTDKAQNLSKKQRTK